MMNINGLQKLTLLDYPGRVACTVFLAGCNMRCPWCHNSEFIEQDAEVVMTDDELIKFLKGRTGILDGVAITGGEPLFRRDIQDLLKKIKDLGYSIKLDTNGSFPDRLKEITDAGLVDYIAMDIKNDPPRYGITVGFPGEYDLTAIKKSIRIIMESGIDYEFRTTVVKELHDEDSFRGIGELIKGAGKYFLQCFVDRDTVIYSGLSAPSKEDLERYAKVMKDYVESVDIRGVE